MNKKIFISLAIILCAIFSFSVCFATDNNAGKVLSDATNGVRDFVGGVENTVENAAKDVSNTSKNITGATENAMNDATTNNGYTTSRVTTDTTIMGMTQNTWTWLILGIAAIAIIAVVWYYSMQFTNNNNHNNDKLD